MTLRNGDISISLRRYVTIARYIHIQTQIYDTNHKIQVIQTMFFFAAEMCIDFFSFLLFSLSYSHYAHLPSLSPIIEYGPVIRPISTDIQLSDKHNTVTINIEFL